MFTKSYKNQVLIKEMQLYYPLTIIAHYIWKTSSNIRNEHTIFISKNCHSIVGRKRSTLCKTHQFNRTTLMQFQKYLDKYYIIKNCLHYGTHKTDVCLTQMKPTNSDIPSTDIKPGHSASGWRPFLPKYQSVSK